LVTLGGLAAPAFWVGMLIILGLLTVFHWMPPMTFVPSTATRSVTCRS